jgi:hypothetical protein
MMKQNGNRLATALILHSSFFLHHFPSLAGAADGPCGRPPLQTATLQPGNSGGALVDARGR